jgi:hypothetical protein
LTEPLHATPGSEPSQATDALPRSGCLFFMLPVGLAITVIVAYAVLFGAGMLGTGAAGERVVIAFSTCPEARPLIQARVEQMGLGQPEWAATPAGFDLTATLPATKAAPHIPTTLARGGVFALVTGEARDGEVIIDNSGLVGAQLSLKELGNPLVIVELTNEAHKRLEAHMEAHVEDSISVWVDDELVLARPNDPPFRRTEVDVRAEGDDGEDNLRRAADWGILLTHGPLPCDARVDSVTPVE